MKNSNKRTNTTLFLLPLLGESKTTTIDDHYFKNAYLCENGLLLIYPDWEDINVDYNTAIKEVLPNFKEGKYSEFPNYIKQKILSFWGITSEKERLYQILYPNNYYLELGMSIPKTKEIWPKPDMEIEIYKYQNYESNNT